MFEVTVKHDEWMDEQTNKQMCLGFRCGYINYFNVFYKLFQIYDTKGRLKKPAKIALCMQIYALDWQKSKNKGSSVNILLC